MAWSSMGCGCVFFQELGSGGATCSGSAVVFASGIRGDGGITCGGSASVDVAGEVWDGYAGVWHLQESGSGVSGEFEDSSPKGLHATGGGGTSSLTPTREDGVFCLQSQRFDGVDDFILVPQDDIGNQSFSISCWTKLESFFKQNSWFARGFTSNSGDKWVFNFGHSILNHILARYNLTDGTTDTEFIAASRNTLEAEKWYHVAVSFDRSAGQAITYINGELNYTNTITSTDPLVSLTNDGYMGKSNQSGFFSTSGGGFDGNILEIRLHPEVKDENFFAAEYNNWCNSDFVLIGDEEVVI